MKLTLSRKEFTRLTELVYMGESVALSADDERCSNEKRYGELIQKIYTLAAQEDGCPEYMEEDGETPGVYVPSMELEVDSPAGETLEVYSSIAFWEELIQRLAERDAEREQMRKPGLESKKIEESVEEQMEREHKIGERYRAEFVKNDLNNVFVMFGTDRLS